MNRFRGLAVCLFLSAAAAMAADVDGKWSGTFPTPNGDVPVGFTFKAEGAALNGSTSGPDGSEIKISDGKADGNNISFVVNLDFGGMPFTMSYKGVVSGDQIKLVIDIFGMPIDMLVKRVK